MADGEVAQGDVLTVEEVEHVGIARLDDDLAALAADDGQVGDVFHRELTSVETVLAEQHFLDAGRYFAIVGERDLHV